MQFAKQAWRFLLHPISHLARLSGNGAEGRHLVEAGATFSGQPCAQAAIEDFGQPPDIFPVVIHKEGPAGCVHCHGPARPENQRAHTSVDPRLLFLGEILRTKLRGKVAGLLDGTHLNLGVLVQVVVQGGVSGFGRPDDE